jgi:hypothetical protein
MRVFDFVCRNGHVRENFVPNETSEVKCPSCGEVARKMVSAPNIKLEGWSGSFPGAAMKWDRDHVKRAKKKPLE